MRKPRVLSPEKRQKILQRLQTALNTFGFDEKQGWYEVSYLETIYLDLAMPAHFLSDNKEFANPLLYATLG